MSFRKGVRTKLMSFGSGVHRGGGWGEGCGVLMKTLRAKIRCLHPISHKIFRVGKNTKAVVGRGRV